MMTTAGTTPVTRRPHQAHAGPPALGPAASIVTFGNLAWLGFVWLTATVVYAVVMLSVARWGSVDESLWQSVVSGWQRYVIFGAGVTVTTTFLRMFVRNGATRGLLSSAATVSMGVIAAIVGAWNVAGFSVERWIYDAEGWPQTLPSEAAFTTGDLPRVFVDNALVVAAYYACGWIVGVCFYRWGVFGGLIRLLPALVPAALMELVVTPDFGGIDIDALATWRERPNLLVTIVGGGALLAATVWLARRLTRATALR